MNKTKRIAVIAILMLVLGFGCAGMQIDTPGKAYLAARDEFNSMLSQYLLHYNGGTPEQQAKWKAEIDPQFEKGNVVLDAWSTALKMKEDPTAHEQEFLNLKNALIDMLADM
jgi:hypothetical protein